MPCGWYVYPFPGNDRLAAPAKPPNRPHRGDRAKVKAARKAAKRR